MNPDNVSTIIPVYNATRYLGNALESVRAQTAGEIIVVDDGSDEPIEAIVRGYSGVTYLRHETNRGPAAARNTGIRASSGDIIAFLDADDWWADGKTVIQLAFLERDPSLQIVLGHVTYAHDPPRPEDGEPLSLESLGAALFRRSAFERLGGFDETLRFGEDTEWFTMAREAGLPMLRHENVALFYRRHGENMTSGRSSEVRAAEMFAILRRSLQRRRDRGGQPGEIERIGTPDSA